MIDYLFEESKKSADSKFIEVLKTNTKISKPLETLVENLSDIIENKVKNEMSNTYQIMGAANILRGLINTLDTIDRTSLENLNNAIDNFLYNIGVEKIVTTDNKMMGDSIQRIVRTYEDPEDENLVKSVSPGYILKTQEGDVVLKYEDIEVNTLNYKTPNIQMVQE